MFWPLRHSPIPRGASCPALLQYTATTLVVAFGGHNFEYEYHALEDPGFTTAMPWKV